MEDNALKKVIARLEYEEGKSFLKNIENKESSKSNYRKWLVAASVVFLIGLSTFFVVQNNASSFPQDLYAEFYEPYPNNYKPIVRGDNDATALAFMAYENKDFKTSSNLFHNLLEEKNNESIRFYYAVSLLSEDRTEAALKEFNKLDSVKFQYQRQTLWYKGLLLLKMNKPKEAQSVFEKLKSMFPKYKVKDVHKILNKVE